MYPHKEMFLWHKRYFKMSIKMLLGVQVYFPKSGLPFIKINCVYLFKKSNCFYIYYNLMKVNCALNNSELGLRYQWNISYFVNL